MKYENSSVYRGLEFVTNLIQLNILWLITCLPVVTIFPATVALICTLRQIHLHKDSSIYSNYFRYFKDNFKQTFLLGLILFVLTGVLYVDFKLIPTFGGVGKLLLPVLVFISAIVSMTLSFIAPTLSHYQLKTKDVIKNSFIFSVIYFPSTFLILVIHAVIALLVILNPILSVFIMSLGFYLNYRICNRVFNKVESLKNKEQVA